jgi:hypothetical protein
MQTEVELTTKVGVVVTLTVSIEGAVLSQPLSAVPLTVYEDVVLGLTVWVFALTPLLHVYVLAPLTFKVAVCPEQIAVELTVSVGTALTVTVVVLTPLHPAVEPATVYVVVALGETEILLVLAPVFHVYVVTPLAVNVVVCPAQIVAVLTVIDKLEPTVTEAVV